MDGAVPRDEPADRVVNPCQYCAVAHGGTYFPALLPGLNAEPYQLMAIVKRHLCAGVAKHLTSCDPQRCVAGLEGAESPAQIVVATKKVWQSYYNERFDPTPRLNSDVTALLDEFDV